MTETLTVQIGDGRLVIALPISVSLVAILLAGAEELHPGSKVLDTGRDDVLVLELGAEA